MRHPRATPAPSPRHLRPIPAWRTIPQPISKRFLSGVITGLRHGDPAYRCLSGIPTWQTVLLTGLWHGDLAYRCFRAISAWRSSHLSALRHGDPAQRCLRGIPAWLTIPQPISKRFLSGVITGLRHGTPAYRHLSGIPAWRSVLLTGLRHGDPAHRYFRAISAWRRGSSDRSSARHPCQQMPQWHPRGVTMSWCMG